MIEEVILWQQNAQTAGVITQVIERTYLADNHSKILLVRSEKGDTVSVIIENVHRNLWDMEDDE